MSPGPKESLTVKRTTVLKESLTNALGQRATLKEGQVLNLVLSRGERYQHTWVKLAEAVPDVDGERMWEGMVYSPHVEILGSAPPSIRIPVPYFSQVDNATAHHGSGMRQCCLTSNAMMANYLLKGGLRELADEAGYKQPESYYGRRLRQDFDSDTTDHGGNTQLLKALGIESYWSHTLSPWDVIKSLEDGIPVVAGVAYRSSGHIVLIVGIEGDNWLVHDPYGIRYGASDRYEVGVDGSFDVYSQATMDSIFWDGGPESGWGRVVTAIEGRPTIFAKRSRSGKLLR